MVPPVLRWLLVLLCLGTAQAQWFTPPDHEIRLTVRHWDPEECRSLLATLVTDVRYRVEPPDTLVVRGQPAALDQVQELFWEMDRPRINVIIDVALAELAPDVYGSSFAQLQEDESEWQGQSLRVASWMVKADSPHRFMPLPKDVGKVHEVKVLQLRLDDHNYVSFLNHSFIFNRFKGRPQASERPLQIWVEPWMEEGRLSGKVWVFLTSESKSEQLAEFRLPSDGQTLLITASLNGQENTRPGSTQRAILLVPHLMR